MKNPGWIRKNWLLMAGVTFIGVPLGTYFIQRAARVCEVSVQRQKKIEE
ncbi:uncharacterized LOC128706666 homolog [Peromyscus eremicus]|nr:uncharacterized LOC128706666 homolog [Peromyscus eremicus]